MIVVLRPGALATVQDLGRPGHRASGIGPGGALSPLALRVANRLVGNEDNAAGLEITLGGCELRFATATRMALCGDDFDAHLDDRPLAPHWSYPVEPGQVLWLGRSNRSRPGGLSASTGFRSWLAFAGGIDVPLQLGSRSTDLRAGFGGFEGRLLKKGDRLPLGLSRLDEAQRARRPFGVRPPGGTEDGGDSDGPPGTALRLRAMPGPEFTQFSASAHTLLWETSWRVTPQSDRMGSRLEGPALTCEAPTDMLSSGVVPGTVQVPPSGQPIILLGDAQTVGGYPRIAVVIRADLDKLAQAPLGSLLRLAPTDNATALAVWRARQDALRRLAERLDHLGWPSDGHVSTRG